MSDNPINVARIEPESKPGIEIISVSHGDAELVLGWWGWYGGTAHVASVLEAAADKALSDPETSRFTYGIRQQGSP
ncbi:MAG: hypothetical protein NTY46_06200 [Candidatus Sumerlaeota bacterium]|nr:hypothetical protein [Candidatus Sumerlaeota bacterium]